MHFRVLIDSLHEFNRCWGTAIIRLAVTFRNRTVMQTRAVMEAAIRVVEETGYDIVPEIHDPARWKI